MEQSGGVTQLLERRDCQQGAVRAVRFNVDGDYVITSGSNKTIKLWGMVWEHFRFFAICFKTESQTSSHVLKKLTYTSSSWVYINRNKLLSCSFLSFGQRML